MSHTLIKVYDDFSAAQNAREQLLASGFSSSSVHLSSRDDEAGPVEGNFTVGNKIISTSDTELRSPQMNLVGDGTVDFDGNLNFHVTAAFDKGLLEVPSSLGPIRDFFIDKEGNYLGDIKLDGTTAEPKFKVNPIPIDKILNNKLLDRVKKGLFGGNPE